MQSPACQSKAKQHFFSQSPQRHREIVDPPASSRQNKILFSPRLRVLSEESERDSFFRFSILIPESEKDTLFGSGRGADWQRIPL